MTTWYQLVKYYDGEPYGGKNYNESNSSSSSDINDLLEDASSSSDIDDLVEEERDLEMDDLIEQEFDLGIDDLIEVDKLILIEESSDDDGLVLIDNNEPLDVSTVSLEVSGIISEEPNTSLEPNEIEVTGQGVKKDEEDFFTKYQDILDFI